MRKEAMITAGDLSLFGSRVARNEIGHVVRVALVIENNKFEDLTCAPLLWEAHKYLSSNNTSASNVSIARESAAKYANSKTTQPQAQKTLGKIAACETSVDALSNKAFL